MTIDYVTIPTLGDAQDFGDLTVGKTRCLFQHDHQQVEYFAGYNPSSESG